MRLRDRDEHLDPGAERELDAVERALAGEPVEADLADWAELTELLRDERPEPDQAWSAELDERAERRFRPGDGGGASARDLGARIRSLLPTRLGAPAGALATLALVAVVAVSTLDLGGTEGGDQATSGDSLELMPVSPEPEATTSSEDSGSATAGADALPPPPDVDSLDSSQRFFNRESGRIAPGTDRRQVERDVTLALSARPDEVRDVTDEAISITRALDGIVISSQVAEAGRQASATLQLTIPTRNLDGAIDQLTELANVKSLNESALDITRPYISSQDRLEDAEAERQQLLEALGNATTDAEAQALRLQIDDARREISRAKSAFENVARRARLSDVSLTIEGDPGADAKDDEGRTIGDWLDDTVSVLRDLAGVLLITAAIVLPLAILGAIIWFAISTLRRHRRERALDS